MEKLTYIAGCFAQAINWNFAAMAVIPVLTRI